MIEQVKRGEKTINAALSGRTSKEQPRRKTVAKEPESGKPEIGSLEYYRQRNEDECVAQWMAESRAKDVAKWQDEWEGGNAPTTISLPLPLDTILAMNIFSDMFRSQSEELREQIIKAVQDLADTLPNLND